LFYIFTELLITNISIYQDTIIYNNIENWQVLELIGRIYLVGTKESTLLLYQFDPLNKNMTLNANITIPERFTSFKIIKLKQDYDKPFNNVYIILFVNINNRNYNLRWFHLVNHRLVETWKWSLEKPVKSLEYFRFNGHHKLLLLYDDSILFHGLYSSFEMYEFNINSTFSQFRQTQFIIF
jgi:hypothetical protein